MQVPVITLVPDVIMSGTTLTPEVVFPSVLSIELLTLETED